MLKYHDGKPVGPDIVAWVQENLNKDRAILSQWIESDGNLAERWGAANADFLKGWEKEHADATAKWHSENPDCGRRSPGRARRVVLRELPQGFQGGLAGDRRQGSASAFFEVWWKAHPKAEFDPVPADMVMASGAGMDPHITLASALYQLDRVAAKRAEMTKRNQTEVRKDIEALLRQNAAAPLAGLAGVDMVNVLEINLALQEKYGS